MDIWSILEIEPTKEVGAIKKAYAKKLKLYHPEDDPTGYQMLREAYDVALKLAKNKKVTSFEKSFESKEVVISNEKEYGESESEKLNEVNFINEKRIYKNIDNTNSIEGYSAEEMDSLIEEFFNKVHNLYKDFHKRIDIKNWQDILNADIIWNLNYKNNISKRMLNFLLIYFNIPKDIWLELNKTFHWSEEENYLSEVYDDYSVNFLLNQIGNEKGLRYTYLIKKEGIDYDNFLEYRQLTFNALNNNDLKSAEKYIALANEIFHDDPDLICMKAEIYVKKNELKKAESIFKEAIKISNKDNETEIYIANIYYNNSYNDQAISICKRLSKLDPNNRELRLLLGKFYLGCREFKKFKKAQYIFLECLNFEDYVDETRKYSNLLVGKYKALYDKEPWNISVIKNLKQLYLALGEVKKAKQVKFKLKNLSSLVRYVGYHQRYIFILYIIIFMFIKQATISVNPTNSHIYISDKNITAKKIEIMWNKVPGAEAYKVYRYNNTSNNYILVNTTDDTKFAESELEPNTQYKYIVASFKNGKKDITSNPITIKTKIFDTVPISKNEYSSLVASDAEKKDANYGNRGNNLVNHGLAVGGGDWYYYTDKDLHNSLYRMKKDGTINEKLHDGYISNLNIVGDWIYFSDSYNICKIKTDGSEYQTIVDNIVTLEFIIIGDWIYFEQGGINKMLLDGSHRSKIIGGDISSFNIDGDWIYYCNIKDKNKLYKVRTNGSNNTKLSEDTCGFINISNGWIYYKNFNDGSRIYKMKLDGTNKTKVTDDTVNFFNVISDTIIYEEKGNLSKTDSNGKNKNVITDTEYNCISIVDDYIFCYKFDGGSKTVYILKFKEDIS